jgi:hypothetical protein
MPFDVQPILDVQPLGAQVQIVARVAAAPRTPVSWRLNVETRGKGGVSSSVQSGRSDGDATKALATVRVNNPGKATLEATAADGRAVSVEASFEPKP